MENRKLTRRDLLKGFTAAGITVAIASCGPAATPAPTQEVAPEPTKAAEPTATTAAEPTATTAVEVATATPAAAASEAGLDNHDVFRPLMSKDEKLTLSRWDSSASAAMNPFYDELNTLFTEFYPNVTMDLQHGQSPENFVAACATGTPPDIWSGGWNPERIGIWAYNGCLLQIDDFLAEVKFPKDRFLPGCWETVVMNGKTYGIPSGVGMYMLWNNPQHLKEVGAQFPKDTDELWADADKLTTRDASGNITRLGMRLTTWFWEHLTWIAAFGGRIWDVEKNEPTPDHPGVVAALQDLVAAVKRYGIDNLDRWMASVGSQQGVAQPFMSGNLSMVIDGDWYLQQFDQLHPDWKPGEQFAVDAAPFAPQSKLQGEPAVSLWVWPQMVTAGSKHPRWGFEFLRFIVSRERAIKGAMKTRDLISTKAYLEDPRVNWESAKVLVRFLKSGKQGLSPLPATPISGEYSDLIGAAVDEIFHLKITPEDGMARVKKEAADLLAKYKK